MRAGVYSLTLFVSAFLLFLVQPMLARFVLPWFGGGSGVWSVCLLFFQSILLLGYLYAHALARLVGLRHQAIAHGILLLASIAVLPLAPSASLQGPQRELPAIALFWLLVRTVGLPCLLISASAPLLQHWFAQHRGISPYRLYAVSNLGSLLGLLSYPLVVEPRLGLDDQAQFWTGGYLALIALSLGSAAFILRSKPPGAAAAATEAAPSPSRRTLALWLALSAAGVMLLLSITTELTSNLVPMPLLWVVPLGLYLLSFIWCFATGFSYRRRRWLSLFSIAILPTLWLPALEPIIGVWPSVLLACASLFSGCMICHGELARLQPRKSSLSLYYLVLACGGVLGSAFVNFGAPALFDRQWELALSLFAVFALAGVCIATTSEVVRPRPNPLGVQEPGNRGLVLGMVGSWLVAGAAFAYLGTLPLRAQTGTVAAARSFFGQLSVVESRDDGAVIRTLVHGRIRHGSQYLDEGRKAESTLYFSPDSGVGLALEHPAYRGPRHVGIVGLGIGTLATYGKAGDRFRFYELDPLVHRFARRYFTFLADSAAQIEVIEGDGRLALQREWASSGAHDFEVLIIDAFNADAVPTHLLTREALTLYWRHLRADGTLAINITNTFLDLAPVVLAQAKALDKTTLLFRVEAGAASRSGSSWILMTSNPALLDDPALRAKASPLPESTAALWTDDHSNVLQALK